MSWPATWCPPAAALVVLVEVLGACAPRVEEAGRPCPCGAEWVCCVALDRCLAPGEVCPGPFPKNPQLSALASGEALDLGPFRCLSAEGEASELCQRISDDAALRYDPDHHRLVMYGAGLSNTDSLFVFDPLTLRWSAAYGPTPCSLMNSDNHDRDLGAWIQGPSGPYPRPTPGPPKDQLATWPGHGEVILFRRSPMLANACLSATSGDDGRVAHYQVDTGQWRFTEARADAMPEQVSAIQAFEFDPPSGLFVSVGQAGLFVYDPDRGTKTRVFRDFGTPTLEYSNELVYSPLDQRHYYFQNQDQKVYALELDRVELIQSRLVPVPYQGDFPEHPQPGYVYDESAEQIVGAISGGQISGFDPRTATFTRRALGLSGREPARVTMQPHAITYDPVDGVVFFVTVLEDGYRTWAYRW